MNETYPRNLSEDYYMQPDSGPSFSSNDLNFYMTCYACPEQYDVFYGGKLVGYVRLRGGALQAYCPDVGEERVYFHVFEGNKNDEWKGCFYDEEERDHFLTEVASSIRVWVQENTLESQSDS